MHIYSEDEMNTHYSEAMTEETRFLLRMAMDQFCMEERWLDYLKDESRHLVFRTYFLIAVREHMPEEYLESFWQVNDMDTLVEKKTECWKQLIDPEGNLQLVNDLKEENEILKKQINHLAEELTLFSDNPHAGLFQQMKEACDQRILANEEMHKLELERIRLQVQKGDFTAVGANHPVQVNAKEPRKLSWWERLQKRRKQPKRDKLYEQCVRNAEYDMDHLELLKEAYFQGESLEVMKTLVKAEKEKKNVQGMRDWLERRKQIMEGWHN